MTYILSMGRLLIRTTLLLTLSLLAKNVVAQSFTVNDIVIEGNQRLESGTIFNYLPLKVGDIADDDEIRLSIKELFATGFFEDVEIVQDGNILLVTVEERPSIAKISFTGNDFLDDEIIEAGLKQAGLVQGRILNPQNLQLMEVELEEAYLAQGRYGTTIESDVVETADNRVNVTVNINESEVSKIKKINIIGAEAISAKQIKKVMTLKDKRGWGFRRKDQYSKQALEADLETIRNYYQDRGYFDFEVISSSVDLSPNKQDVFININVFEGEVYRFGSTIIEGVDRAQQEKLAELLVYESGDIFSRKKLSESQAEMLASYADSGFAFADIRSTSEANSSAREVNPIITVVPNQRVNVRRIEIVGNHITKDEVIRRELRQFEGSWFSAEKLSLSTNRLRRLGFFDDITIETPPVPGTNDQVDMIVRVVERDTGSIQLSAGYSDADGAILGVGFEQRNLLGTGKNLSLRVSNSDATTLANFRFTNPYINKYGVSRTWDILSRRTDSSEVDTAEYIYNLNSIGVTHRIPIAETNSFSFGVSVADIDLDSTDETPDEYLALINEKPDGIDLVTTFGISRDNRNDFFFPTDGSTAALTLEASVPGSEYEYYKASVEGNVFFPITQTFTIKVGGSYSYGGGYGDSSGSLPFFRNYFAGGINSVRGYQSRSLGPRDSGPSPEALGGNQRVLGNLELLFPAFGSETRDKRFSLFVDGGQIYNDSDDIDDSNYIDDIRFSTGIAYHWISPLGPFSLSYGVPLNEETGDETDKFQVTFGTTFN